MGKMFSLFLVIYLCSICAMIVYSTTTWYYCLISNYSPPPVFYFWNGIVCVPSAFRVWEFSAWWRQHPYHYTFQGSIDCPCSTLCPSHGCGVFLCVSGVPIVDLSFDGEFFSGYSGFPSLFKIKTPYRYRTIVHIVCNCNRSLNSLNRHQSE